MTLTKSKIEKAFNKALCERYPFLIPRNIFSDEIVGDWGYEWTELDSMAPGWRKSFGIQFMEDLRDDLLRTGYLDEFRITQIKEKYGELRFYVSSAHRSTHDIIDRYESLSRRVCMLCGNPAELKWVNGWADTICDECLERISQQ